MSSMHFDEGGAFILQMPFRLHDFSQKTGFQMCFIHTVALVRLFVVESLKYAYGKKESQPPSGKTGMLTKSGRMWFRALWRLEHYENE